MTDSVKLNFEMTPTTAARLDRLKAETDAESKRAVIVKALAVYQRLDTASNNGDKLISRDEDGNETELILL